MTVRDQGPGIELERQQATFLRFERADAGRKTGSYGLGLWIVKNLTEALGGEVALESAPGKGSVFALHLPVGVDEQLEPAATG